MSKKLFFSLSLSHLLLLPTFILAQTGAPPWGTVAGFGFIGNIIGLVINIFWGIAVASVIAVFIVGGLKFFGAAGLVKEGSPTKAKQARDLLIYGLVGTIVIALAWSVLFTITSLLSI